MAMWNAKLYLYTSNGWEQDYYDPGYCDEQYRRMHHRDMFALVRQRDSVVLASSRLSESDTAALYAAIGRTETEAA